MTHGWRIALVPLASSQCHREPRLDVAPHSVGPACGNIVRRARLARIRPCSWTGLWLIALVLVGGCGQSTPASRRADVSIKQDLLRGVRQIRANPDRKKLHAELVRTLRTFAVRTERRRAHGAGETGCSGVRGDAEGSPERDRLRRERQRGSRGCHGGRSTGRSVPDARRESVTRGRASARRSDRRAQWTLISHPRCRPADRGSCTNACRVFVNTPRGRVPFAIPLK